MYIDVSSIERTDTIGEKGLIFFVGRNARGKRGFGGR